MPTLVQEFDVSQFEAGVLRIRRGLDDIEGFAQQAGKTFDGAFDGKRPQEFSAQTRTAGQSIGVMSAAARIAGPLIAGLFTQQTIARVIGFATAFEQIDKTIRAAIPSLRDLEATQTALADIARESGAQFQAVATTYAQFTRAGEQLGLTQAQVLDITDTLTRGIALFATSAEAGAAVQTQLAQAFASGVLQGDEFRSVTEGLPPLITAISEVTGVAREDLKAFASEGNITSDVLVQAFGVLGEEVDALAGTIQRTSDQATQGFLTTLTEFVGKVDQAVGATDIWTVALDNASENIQAIGDAVIPANDALADQEELISDLRARLEFLNDGFDLFGLKAKEAEQVEQELNAALQEQARLMREAGVATDGLTFAQANLAQAVDFGTDNVRELNTAAGEFTLSAAQQEDALRAQQAAFGDVEFEAEKYATTSFIATDATEALGEATVELAAFSAHGGKALALAAEEAERLAEEAEEARQAAIQLGQDTFEAAQLAARGFGDIPEALQEVDAFMTGFFERREAELEEQANQASQLAGVFEVAFGDIQASMQEAATNVNAIFNEVFGVSLTEILNQASATIANWAGLATETINNLFSAGVKSIRLFGFEIEDVIGAKAAGIIEGFASFTGEEFQAIRDAGQKVLDFFGVDLGLVAEQGKAFISGFAQAAGEAFFSLGAQAAQFGQTFITAMQTASAGGIASFGAFAAAGTTALVTLTAGTVSLQQEFGVLQGTMLALAQFTVTSFIGAFELFGINATGAVRKVGQEIGGFLKGAIDVARDAFSALGGVATGVFNAIGGVVGNVVGAIGNLIGLIKDAIGAVKDLSKAIGGIPGLPSIPGVTGGGGVLDFIPGVSTAKKVLKKLNPFEQGGIITGRTELASFGGLGGQSAFQTGGLLDPFTFLRGGSVRPASAVAGEAGPEAILPLTRTQGGDLGVRAVVPANGRSGNVVQVIFVEGVDRSETDRIKAQLRSTSASIEFRSAAVLGELLGAA